ncbi:MAG: hypothetical protein CM15mP68_5900 [Pseudomonadota bacterium]|nr:MAG: hypothetical protein CM15mP68_5900 [Pseudomonadota bacterium]
MNDWTVKITGQPLGQDKHQTFRVSNGILEVRYDQYTAFDNQFGHLFFNQPFAHYELLVEYRFVGEQLRGGPGWATRNSGVMLHAQEPASMSVDQDFPDSVEAQFLGGFSDNQPRPTGNVCTPGTEVMLDDALAPHHCSYSSSATFDGDQWVQIRIVVNGHGTSLIRLAMRQSCAITALNCQKMHQVLATTPVSNSKAATLRCKASLTLLIFAVWHCGLSTHHEHSQRR